MKRHFAGRKWVKSLWKEENQKQSEMRNSPMTRKTLGSWNPAVRKMAALRKAMDGIRVLFKVWSDWASRGMGASDDELFGLVRLLKVSEGT